MAGGEVKTRASLDASRFTRGTRSVRRNIKQLERGLTVDLRKAARIASRGIMAVGAAGAAVGAGLTVGINKALQLGARLDHLKTQTGIAAGSMQVLEQAFEDNGASADMVGKTVSRLQRRIVKAEQGSKSYADALAVLGLKTQDLINMTPEKQFATVAEAISKVENQSRKAQAAMELFGNEGAKLMGVFEEGALDSAAESLGAQTDILNRRAGDFEEAATLLDRAGNKMSGFFVGISDRIIDTILPLLNRMDSLDFAEQGQRFGDGLERGIRAVIGVFQGNTFGDVVANSLIVGGKEFLNAIIRGWKGIALGFWEMFKTGWAENLATIKNGFEILARGFLVKILDGLSAAASSVGMTGRALSLTRAAGAHETKQRQAQRRFRDNIDPETRIERLTKAFEDGMIKAADSSFFNTDENKRNIADLIKSAMQSVETRGPTLGPTLGPNITPEQLAALRGQAGSGSDATDTDEASRSAQFAAASSLAKIGGGGGVGPTSGTEALVDQTKRQTKIQEKTLGVMEQLRDKLGNTGGFQPAVFA